MAEGFSLAVLMLGLGSVVDPDPHQSDADPQHWPRDK